MTVIEEQDGALIKEGIKAYFVEEVMKGLTNKYNCSFEEEGGGRKMCRGNI